MVRFLKNRKGGKPRKAFKTVITGVCVECNNNFDLHLVSTRGHGIWRGTCYNCGLVQTIKEEIMDVNQKGLVYENKLE